MKLKRYEQAGAVFSEDLSSLSYVRKKYGVNGNPTIINSARGKAMDFDGTNDYLIMNKKINFNGELTVCCWIKSGGSISDFRRLLSNSTGDNPRWILYFNNGPLIMFVNDTGGNTVATSPLSYDDEEWHFVVGTINSSGVELFIDGLSVATDSNTINNFISTGNFEIASYNNGVNPFNGSIKDAIIFNRVLTATEISNIYNNKSFDYEKNVISEWDMSSI